MSCYCCCLIVKDVDGRIPLWKEFESVGRWEAFPRNQTEHKNMKKRDSNIVDNGVSIC